MAEDEKKAVELDDEALDEVAGGESTSGNICYCANCDAYTEFSDGFCCVCGVQRRRVKGC